MKTQALAATMLGAMILASTASAQTFIRSSGNGTGNTINVGGGFGRTEIFNSGNGNFNTINAGGGFGRTEIFNSGNGDFNTINAGGGFGPSMPRQSGHYPQATSFYGPEPFSGSGPTATCYSPGWSHPVRTNDYYPRSAVGQPFYQSSRQRTPRLSLAGLPPINVNVVKNSGNGTGNTINLPGGGSQSGLNLNLISNSANGTGNAINLGGGFPR